MFYYIDIMLHIIMYYYIDIIFASGKSHEYFSNFSQVFILTFHPINCESNMAALRTTGNIGTDKAEMTIEYIPEMCIAIHIPENSYSHPCK